MDQQLSMRILGDIMQWDDETTTREHKWLRTMAAIKYDGYGDFRAGMRFVESLANWLHQFESEDREVAYGFVKTRLVYVGPAEIFKLVSEFYPTVVRPHLQSAVALELDIDPWGVLASPDAEAAERRILRQTVFVALSDGARLDGVRHQNTGLISNEQMLSSTQVDVAKWKDMRDDMRDELGDQTATFRQIYLVDDFAGTGTSFFRRHQDGTRWTGKLWRFHKSVRHAHGALAEDGGLLDDGWNLFVHHYVATSRAEAHIADAIKKAAADLASPGWASRISPSYGMVFDEEFPLKSPADSPFIRLTDKYYDRKMQTKHTDVGGVTHQGLGYGGAALPLVMDHNTPNNSAGLLHYDSEGKPFAGDHNMRPLFRRRTRHS